MEKISVIIPIYNTEKYIKQCAMSVMHQPYRELEILLIDDGSTDHSLEICESLAQTDSRIKVYHQEKGGAAKARNYGLDMATGDYVFFLDSDDAVHPLLLGDMARQLDSMDADMAFCDCARIEDAEFDGIVKMAPVPDMQPEWESADGYAAEEWFHIKYKPELSGVWGLFRKTYIGGQRFDESYVRGEDTLFKYHLFCRQGRAIYTHAKWYYYRMRPGSVTHAAGPGLRHFLDSEFFIRDHEHERKRHGFALAREYGIVRMLQESYAACLARNDADGCSAVKAIAMREQKTVLFRSLVPSVRLRFRVCFRCYPIYAALDRCITGMWIMAGFFKGRKT